MLCNSDRFFGGAKERVNCVQHCNFEHVTVLERRKTKTKTFWYLH